ncbi:MAG: class I SAM-dependent methyltransferase [Bacteroidota bacterium]
MPTNFSDVICSICNNNDPKEFKIKYAKEDYNICECKQCSFVFIPSIFRKKVSYQNYKDLEVANAVRNGNNFVKIERHKLRFNLIRKYKSSGSLFDLGVGWGHFLLTGKQLGYDVYGIEISEQPYLYSKNDLKLPVDHIDFFEMKEDKAFDIITMWDVLEHIDKADSFIEKCARISSKDGLLIIQVPQIDSFFAKKYKHHWKMISLDHVNYFRWVLKIHF